MYVAFDVVAGWIESGIRTRGNIPKNHYNFSFAN